MSSSILSLPIPILILLHLHILEYPQANKPEYDHNIFNGQVRGLRDRTKLMEDICYFLVGKVEKGRDVARSPSETVAFRTSLSKYLEALRHQSIYPASNAKVASGKGKKVVKDSAIAWWWKDVVVRKSLLEECSGDKFERLILSVSTHALLKTSSKLGKCADPENAISLLNTQPWLYNDLLSQYTSTRHAWSRSAAVLLRHKEDLKALRSHILSQDGSITSKSKYSSLSNDRLVAFAKSKRQDLLDGPWDAEVLEYLIELSGLKLSSALLTSSIQDTIAAPAHVKSHPTSLPIAAAHHPSRLKRLRKAVYHAEKSKPHSHVKVAFSATIEAERRMADALADALGWVKARKKKLEAKVRKRILPMSNGRAMNLWTSPPPTSIDFDNQPQPTPALLASLSLYTPVAHEAKGELGRELEARIDNIRHALLPTWPAIPDYSVPRLPARQPVLTTNATSIREARAHQDTHIPRVKGCAAETPNPVNVILSPQKNRRNSRMPRKSIRFSLAVTKRPELFISDDDVQGGETENEVEMLIHNTEDDSMDSIPVSGFSTSQLSMHTPRPPLRSPSKGIAGTPRSKRVNRIYTAGTPKPKGNQSTLKKPKLSFPMALLAESGVPLPSLVSGSDSFGDMMLGSDDEDEDEEWNSNSLGGAIHVEEGEEVYEDEAPSMTLRDILLNVDTTQFDLLDDEDASANEIEDESFGWD
ncbi:hypothetical protein BDQ12DRAFT_665401 [Crucibulum laeve]|uniref:HAUS augmin-like complex subunit 6 N-terminus-domain-containing protein n=1 Tax=Crucibulum laeve TaxID=68775 RepID=A0A5C3M436_9AGAR|nr:hypothetical protein BDQ12DRAFT_665401 [Crucibulum laeve]